MSPVRPDWRKVALGGAAAGALVLLVLVTPWRASGTDAAVQGAYRDIHQAVRKGDEQGLLRAEERLGRVLHRDLLFRDLPGVLRVVNALRRTPKHCDPGAGTAFDRGICLIRRGQFREALVALAAVPAARGGAAYRDVAAELLVLDATYASSDQRSDTGRSKDELGGGSP